MPSTVRMESGVEGRGRRTSGGSADGSSTRVGRRCLMADSVATIQPKFAGHETFTLHYGWLKKAVDCDCKDPEVFLQDDALVTLGVGKKRWIRSIRQLGADDWHLGRRPSKPRNRGGVRPKPTAMSAASCCCGPGRRAIAGLEERRARCGCCHLESGFHAVRGRRLVLRSLRRTR